MALDPLRSLSAIPAPSKAAKAASAGTSSAAPSFESALAASSAPASRPGAGSSDGPFGGSRIGASSGANSGASVKSGAGFGAGARSGSGQRTRSSTSAAGGKHGASAANPSDTTGASAQSSSGSSNSNAKASGEDSGSPTASPGAKPGSNTRPKPGASQSQTDTANADAASAASLSAANQIDDANQQDNTPPATFIEKLAQSQAHAAQNAAAAVSTTAPTIAAPADPEAVTGPTNGKVKASSDKDSDATSPSSLAFISQSLAAAIVGVQQPIPPQAITTTASSATTDSDSDSEAATDAVSMASSGSAAAAQSLVTTLANDTADALKAATDANTASSGPKSDTPPNTAPAADGSSAAMSAFQAQMSISSHFQQPPTADNSPNRINAPVGSPAFNDELGGKITWLANQGIQSASVQLSPEHLGPVSVHISVQAGSASVSFNAAHADTRAALEQALPRLREMFATNGLTLSDANVSHQSPRGQAQKQSISAIGGVGGSSNGTDETTSSGVTSVAVSHPGLVDTYA